MCIRDRSVTVQAMPDTFGMYGIMRKEDDFAKVSPFLIEKVLTGCAGSGVQNIRKIAGGLLIETLNDQQGLRLL